MKKWMFITAVVLISCSDNDTNTKPYKQSLFAAYKHTANNLFAENIEGGLQ